MGGFFLYTKCISMQRAWRKLCGIVSVHFCNMVVAPLLCCVSSSNTHVAFYFPITFTLPCPSNKCNHVPQTAFHLQRLWKRHRNDRLVFVFSAAILSCLSPSHMSPSELSSRSQSTQILRILSSFFALMMINHIHCHWQRRQAGPVQSGLVPSWFQNRTSLQQEYWWIHSRHVELQPCLTLLT